MRRKHHAGAFKSPYLVHWKSDCAVAAAQRRFSLAKRLETFCVFVFFFVWCARALTATGWLFCSSGPTRFTTGAGQKAKNNDDDDGDGDCLVLLLAIRRLFVVVSLTQQAATTTTTMTTTNRDTEDRALARANGAIYKRIHSVMPSTDSCAATLRLIY